MRDEERRRGEIRGAWGVAVLVSPLRGTWLVRGLSAAVALVGVVVVIALWLVCSADPAAAASVSRFAGSDAAGAGVEGTPCTAAARACVDLSTQQAWLLTDGQITHGPVSIGSGGPGEDTPVGTFHVLSKDKNHVSAEEHGIPMPYSVFFAPGGVAFHGGNTSKASAGCVHMSTANAIIWFTTLKIGDDVQVRQATPARHPSTSDNHDN